MDAVQPPRIESFFLPGPAGRLECLLKHPANERPDTGAAVVCHPHPLFGGTMHNKVVHAAAEAMTRAGLPVMRFNFRGVGASGGRHANGVGEQDDLKAVLDELARRFPGRPIVSAGYSFGSFVALRVGCVDPRVEALIGIAAPVALIDFTFLRECRKPLTLIHGTEDPYGPLPLLMTLAAILPGGARVAPIDGAAHSFGEQLESLAQRVTEAIPPKLRAVEGG